MSLHPQVKSFLERVSSKGAPPLEELTVTEARSTFAKICRLLKIEDRKIPGFHSDITIRIYTPSERTKLPVLVYFHGGGWVIGDLETHDPLCRSLSNQADCIVISVDYSLAPENKFPVAVEDAYLAVKWISDHADDLGIDKNSIAVGGDSAGGNLAAVICYLAHQRKAPAIAFQLLFYPSTGFTLTPSIEKYGEGYHLTNSTMKWFRNQYLTGHGDTRNPLAAPMHIPDQAAPYLPPAYVMTAEYDPLCDGGEQFARKLQRAGVKTKYVCYPGMIHGFLCMTEILDDAKTAIQDAANALKEQFSTQKTN